MATITKPVIYQVFTRLFGNTIANNVPYGTIEENGVGKFDDFSDKALKSLKSMGVTHMWYTGVIEHAVLTDYQEYGIRLDDADVVKGRAGSPYAIKDYFDVNPDLAVDVDNRMAEFEALIKRTHDNGLKVIIDFVPNHVARGYISDAKPYGIADFGENDNTNKAFDPNNNFYYIVSESFQVPSEYNSLGNNTHPTKDGQFDESPAKATGNDVFSAAPSVNDWFETVKLNYGVDYQNDRQTYFDPVPDTWLKMEQVLSFWTNKGVDGFRCDMAEMVPVEFWGWVIPRIKTINPDITFTAEIYNPDSYRNYIFNGKFDFLYDKVELYDTLKHIIRNRASTDDIPVIWQRQEGIEANMLRFLENHDEQRIPSPDFAGSAENAIPAMVLSATMNSGPIMVYFGQEVGEPGEGVAGFSGEDGRTTIFDYWGVPEFQKWVNNKAFDGGGLSDRQKQLRQFYSDILNLCNESKAISEGGFYDLHYYNRSAEYTGHSDKVYAYLRHHDGENLLIAVNFDHDNSETVNLKIPTDALSKLGLNGGNISLTSLDQTIALSENSSGISDHTKADSFSFELSPNGYSIFKLESSN
ncbi:MAG: alpha-amylase family glycosyl hydrolase [Cyclobacteriaceae bacterium]